MARTTVTGRPRPVTVVAVLVLGLTAGPGLAHPGEGRTPYRYVVAPPGVPSEGVAEPGASTQPIGPPGFAGTTDNQLQLTLPPGALPPRSGETQVRVLLEQLDPATLPPLPPGLEPEGNGYRVRLAHAASGLPVEALAVPATLSVSAPAPPTDVLELVDGVWTPVPYRAVVDEAAVSSVLRITRPLTLLQVYDRRLAPSHEPTPAPAALPAAAAPPTAALPLVVVALSAAVLIGALLARRRRRRA